MCLKCLVLREQLRRELGAQQGQMTDSGVQASEHSPVDLVIVSPDRKGTTQITVDDLHGSGCMMLRQWEGVSAVFQQHMGHRWMD